MFSILKNGVLTAFFYFASVKNMKGGHMLNQVILVGRLTKNPEIIETESGKKMCFITLAVQRPFKNVDGLYETDFIRCVLWNIIAETTVQYSKVGDVIGVKGRLQVESYSDENNNTRYNTEVVAERISFIGSGKIIKEEE